MERSPTYNFSMRGKVRRNRENFYIDLHWKGERLRLFTDKAGYPFYSERQANRTLEAINAEIDLEERGQGRFDPRNYIKRELKALRWINYLEAWIERQRKRQKAGEISREYLRMIQSLAKNHIRSMFNNQNIRDLTKGIIDDAFTALPQHLSLKTKYNIQGVIAKIFQDAFDREDIPRVPKMSKINLVEPETTFCEEEDQEKILAEVRHPVARALFRFCMKHGCRPGEGRALRLSKIDFKAGLVTISAAMDQNEYRPYTKTKRNRTIPLHPECAAEIQTLPRAIDNDFVFVINGKPLRKEYVNTLWRRARDKAGLTITCYEGTRHSLISQLLNDGHSETLVREIVGHTNPKTMDRYKHIKAESLRPLIERQQTVSNTKKTKGKLLKIGSKKK